MGDSHCNREPHGTIMMIGQSETGTSNQSDRIYYTLDILEDISGAQTMQKCWAAIECLVCFSSNFNVQGPILSTAGILL